VFSRLAFAGFVSFDDDFQVYANPFLNPPTLHSVARFWAHAYEQLYVPLAYTLFAAVAALSSVPGHHDVSLGAAVSLSPAAFHVANIALHVANVLLCFTLILRLTGRRRTALICALVFAVHPLQVESVGWISELRGLSSACLALLALNAFALSRQAGTQGRARTSLAVSVLFVAGAMLCKPSAAALPLIAIAIDRVAFHTPWRKALTACAIWLAVVVPFIWATRSAQPIPAAAHSFWWQRPFVAGDALAFYAFKTVLPLRLCVDYGRAPRWLLSHGWGYLTWLLPASLLLLAYRARRQRPFIWLGGLLFVLFLLPTLGLVPFAYQAFSTVADRYAYLALIGVGLVASALVDHVPNRKTARRATALVAGALGLLAFAQSGHWLTSPGFLRHTIDVNPMAAFAYDNLGDTELANGDLTAALGDYQSAIGRDPTRVKTYVNLAEVYTALNRPADADEAVSRALAQPDISSDDLSNLGIVLMKMNQPARALDALAAAVKADPSSPTYLFNQANALSAAGRFQEAESAFRRCLDVAPTLVGAHTGLGIVLAETGRLPDALAEFRTAVRLQPDDPGARDNLKRAEQMMER
jgi:tetratricopeptide (TPR) repeat protein